MKINTTKSNIMIFNMSRSYAFPPEFSFNDGDNFLEVLSESKLLGIYLTSNLTWHKNTENMVRNAMKRMWLIQRMKRLHLDSNIKFEYYLKEIRPTLEYAVPVWNSGLSSGQVKQLERVQKIALKVILGPAFTSYSEACSRFNIESLAARRYKLCVNFAIKLYKSERRRHFFELQDTQRKTRNRKVVVEKRTRTTRCYNAPHNALARLVNENAHRFNL